MNAKIVTGTSKKTGRQYKCIEVKVGAYAGRLFPTPAEVAYLEMYLTDKAHKDFQKDGLEDVIEN